jgi:hypothetical protein
VPHAIPACRTPSRRAARHPGDPAFAELLERVLAVSPEARAWWPQHNVAPISSGRKRLRHPALGVLELEHVVLHVAEGLEQKVVSVAAPDRDQERIADLLRGAGD